MKVKLVFLISALALLAFAATSDSQQPVERRVAEVTLPIQVGPVTEQSPAVSLSGVGKEVAPGVFEVDPNSIRGKRLVLPPSGGGTARHICIGKWDAQTKTCKGIYIEW